MNAFCEQRNHRRTPIAGYAGRAQFFLCIAVTMLMSGCAVVTVVGAAASVAATAASTAVDVGVGAVRVTGKVVGKGVDIVTGSPSSPSAPAKP